MNELSPFDQVESLIQEAIVADDISIVLSQIDKMMQARELVGKVLAKAIYLFHSNWSSFSASMSDNFFDVMESINLHKYTVQRYLKVCKYQKSLPEFMQDKPIRDIIPVTNVLAQGYEISDDNWDSIRRASNSNEIQRIVTKYVRGKEPRKGSLQICLDSKGTYYGWKNGERHNAGFLDVNSDDPVVQEIIERTINNTGVILK